MSYILDNKKECSNEMKKEKELLLIVERVPVEAHNKESESLSNMDNLLGEAKCEVISITKNDLLKIVERIPVESENKVNVNLIKVDKLLDKSGYEVAPQDDFLQIVERVKPMLNEKADVPLIGKTNDECGCNQVLGANDYSVEKSPLIKEGIVSSFATVPMNLVQTLKKGEIIRNSQSVLQAVPMESQNDVKEKKVSAMRIALQLAEIYQFGTYEENIYVFENNYYKLCSTRDLEKIVFLALKRSDIIPPGYKYLQDICSFLKLETMSRKFTEDDVAQMRKYIGFRNGYLHMDSLRFVAPTPGIFITNILEVDYNVNLLGNVSPQGLKHIKCPNFDQFIASLADGNGQIFGRIYEMIGYILSNDCAAKKLFVLSGVSNSGKSKLGEFVMRLFNEGAVVSIPIGELGGQFSLGVLPGKSLCVDLDLPATKINSKTAAKIKSLTGGDATSAENKYEIRKTFVNRAKLLYATNHPIEISEKEYVLKNRFVSIPIMRTVPKERQCPNLLDYFEDEKFLIIMKSIGYYLDLVKNNYEFTGEFPLNSAFIQNASGVAMPMEDMIKRFTNERCLITSLDQWEYAEDLYKAYCEYYDIVEIDAEYRNFSRIFNQLLSDRIGKTKKRRDKESSPMSVFTGVVIKKNYK